MASTSFTGLSAGTTVVAADVFAYVDVSDNTQSPAGSTLKITASNFYANVLPITLAGGTVTVSTPVFQATQTWNAGGVTFTGIDLNVTDSASAAASLLVNLRVGGTSQWRVTKGGATTQLGLGTFSAGIAITGAGTFTTSLSSTTALATPGALVATQFTAFASTVSGAALMGFGTTNDVSLMNRAGTVCLGIGPNTTAVNIPGSLVLTGATVTGTPTWASSQAITLSTAAQPNVTSLGTLTGLAVTSGASLTVTLTRSGSATGTVSFQYANTAARWSTGINITDVNNDYEIFNTGLGTTALLVTAAANAVVCNATFRVMGAVRLDALSGVGSRTVVADANGNLSAP